MENRIKIVHITPHLGGGVGISLANFIDQSEKVGVDNRVLCLDWCENLIEYFRTCSNLTQGLFWYSRELVYREIFDCDCVVIHYWNHPLISVFLSDFLSIKNKSIIWCHNSGLSEPHIIPSYLIDIADSIVFTSLSSIKAPNFDILSHGRSRSALFVPTVRDLGAYLSIGANRTLKTSIHKLLYVGAVTRSKMNPDAALIFAQLSRRGFQIDVVGGPDHAQLADEVESLGGRIKVFGHVDNVVDFYAGSDVFVYPLRDDHYGTGEQVILEALASGLPIVAFNNPAEVAILNQFAKIKLANSTSEFIQEVLNLTASPQELLKMSRELHLSASLIYGSNQMTDELLGIVKNTVESSRNVEQHIKRTETIDDLLAVYARASFFDTALYAQILSNPRRGVELILKKIEELFIYPSKIERWQAKTKSTPEHYFKYFPESEPMGKLVRELRDWPIRN